MDYIAMRMILVAATILMSLSMTAIVCADEPLCESNTFDQGSAYEANVATILEGLRVSTASIPDRAYSMHLSSPDVTGSSSCFGSGMTLEDCTACLSTAVDSIRASCVRSMGASDLQANCVVEYHTIWGIL